MQGNKYTIKGKVTSEEKHLFLMMIVMKMMMEKNTERKMQNTWVKTE